MELQSVGKLLVLIGAVIALAGLLFWAGGRLGLGSLPGDFRLTGRNWGCFIPLVSSIIISLLLTLLLNLAARFLR